MPKTTLNELNDVSDLICKAHDFMNALFLMGASIVGPDGDAIQAVAGAGMDVIADARAQLRELAEASE